MKRVLIVSADMHSAGDLRSCMEPDFDVDQASDADDCFQRFSKQRYDFLILDVDVVQPGAHGADDAEGYRRGLQPFTKTFPSALILALAPAQKVREAVAAVRGGAANYLSHPFSREEVRLVFDRATEALRMRSEIAILRDQFWRPEFLEFLQTGSPAMQGIYDKIKSVAPTKTTVLFTGETGVGKGMLASILHHHSGRRERQFLSVHCGAVPDTLLESELFGHERGAFTGAVRRKLGKFEVAQGGTLFLDEIGTLTPSAQVKLLQVLQDKTFQRVGGEEVLRSDARIVAATNADLPRLVELGRFREDLFYRINVFPIHIPPLRERPDDIPILVRVFLSKLNNMSTDRRIDGIEDAALELLRAYDWPGNIRELENLVERAFILETGSMLTVASFPQELFLRGAAAVEAAGGPRLSLTQVREHAVADAERRYLTALLSAHRGKIEASARAAGLSSRQLHNLMVKYNLHKEDFKITLQPEAEKIGN